MRRATASLDGVVSSKTAKNTLVIACGAISHELIAVAKVNHWQHLEIQCLPAHWHNTPEKITPAIEEKLQRDVGHYEKIFIAYADCGTGGKLDAMLKKYNIERLPGDHCYGFFAGQAVFDAMAQDELGTFYLTDYLLDHFQRLILDGLGISRHPELLPQYFAHYTKLLYLCQDSHSEKYEHRVQRAQDAAQTLGLTLQVHNTTLSQFSRALAPLDVKIQRIDASSQGVSNPAGAC